MIQFIHANVYSRAASNGKQHSMYDIRDEALREAHATPHIEKPDASANPLLYGQDLDSTIRAAEAYAETMTSSFERKNRKTGAIEQVNRKMRADGHTLIAGVYSAPSEMSDADWNSYKQDMIDELRRQFGDRLKTVIEHCDEPEASYRQSVENGHVFNDKPHRHCHWYVVPLPGERMDEIHPGYKAAAASKARGEVKGMQNQAYRAAMREWQSTFYENVSVNYGMARIGPKRQRLDRAEYKAQQAERKAIALQLKEAQAEMQRMEREHQEKLEALKAKQEAQEALISKATEAINKAKAEWNQLTKNREQALSMLREYDKMHPKPVPKLGWFDRAASVFGHKTENYLEHEKRMSDLEDRTKAIEAHRKAAKRAEQEANAKLEEIKADQAKLEEERKKVVELDRVAKAYELAHQVRINQLTDERDQAVLMSVNSDKLRIAAENQLEAFKKDAEYRGMSQAQIITRGYINEHLMDSHGKSWAYRLANDEEVKIYGPELMYVSRVGGLLANGDTFLYVNSNKDAALLATYKRDDNGSKWEYSVSSKLSSEDRLLAQALMKRAEQAKSDYDRKVRDDSRGMPGRGGR